MDDPLLFQNDQEVLTKAGNTQYTENDLNNFKAVDSTALMLTLGMRTIMKWYVITK